MALDLLYTKIKYAKFPIKNRKELFDAIGVREVEFEGNWYNAKDISIMVKDFPIKRASHLVELFI